MESRKSPAVLPTLPARPPRGTWHLLAEGVEAWGAPLEQHRLLEASALVDMDGGRWAAGACDAGGDGHDCGTTVWADWPGFYGNAYRRDMGAFSDRWTRCA